MKKVVVVLVLFSQLLQSQEPYWYIEQSLVPYVAEYVYDSASNDSYNKSYLIENIDYIFYSDNLGTVDGSHVLGKVGNDMRGVYISNTIEGNYPMVRLVLYHEFGHILVANGGHSCVECYDVMSSSLPEDVSSFSDNLFWEERVSEYFIWLEENR